MTNVLEARNDTMSKWRRAKSVLEAALGSEIFIAMQNQQKRACCVALFRLQDKCAEVGTKSKTLEAVMTPARAVLQQVGISSQQTEVILTEVLGQSVLPQSM